MVKAGIIGAKGYTARELLRLLPSHPEVELAFLMARVEAAEPVENHHPQARGIVTLPIEPMALDNLRERCDVVFLALPHTIAQEYAPGLIEQGILVVDLSADFRFDSVPTFERVYGTKHLAPELNSRFPYAQPELFREEIAGAPGLAIPGCYVTSALLALAPVVIRGESCDLSNIIVNSLSGVSGAGRTPAEAFHFPEANESAMAYKVGGHRHRPEIEEKLSRIAQTQIKVTFTPHLAPLNRGILSTVTVPLRRELTAADAHAWFEQLYAHEPFVRVLPAGQMPTIAAVAMTNCCDIGVAVDTHTGQLIVCSTIDNLTKGASGQAIQAMNARLGFPETMGLMATTGTKQPSEV
jgi:N-acetyl-gamma-glutamyl-phosphate reductase